MKRVKFSQTARQSAEGKNNGRDTDKDREREERERGRVGRTKGREDERGVRGRRRKGREEGERRTTSASLRIKFRITPLGKNARRCRLNT